MFISNYNKKIQELVINVNQYKIIISKKINKDFANLRYFREKIKLKNRFNSQ